MQSGTDPLEGLGERVLAVAAALDAARIPHAFGGAIAYNYVGEPRATRDIDINIFLPETGSEPTLGALRDVGVSFNDERVRRFERLATQLAEHRVLPERSLER